MAKLNLQASFPGMNLPVEQGASTPFQPAWYYLLQALFNRTGQQPGIDIATVQTEAQDAALLAILAQMARGTSTPLPFGITVSASPFTYQAPFAGTVLISGGTVSAVQFSRDHTTFFDYPHAGPVQVATGDIVKVTYTGLPTMTMIGREQ